ncbi:MAG: glycosyltransferase [Bacteroidia bacterium]|nr:glycosyltransferase [Bacteroidia bacterium]
MKVLYLTYDGLLDPLGQSQILPYLYGIRERLGVEYHIISFEKAARRKEEEPLRRELQQHGIRWYPLSFTKNPPLLAKVYDNWRFFRTGLALMHREGFQLIHARSYVAGWVAHRLHRRYRVPWIFDMRGFWADERRETKAWPPHHPFYHTLYQLWKKREALMLHSAAHIIVLTEAAKAILLEWNIPESKITVIPCVADYEHFKPHSEQREAYRKQLGIPSEAFVLGYLGSIGPLYEVREMLRFFRVLLRINPESYMVFFTPASPGEIFKHSEALGIPRERLRIQFIRRKEVPLWGSVMDASIIFCVPGFSRIGSSPTRVAEVLAMDIPMIMQADLGDNRTLSQNIAGIYLCESFSEESYEQLARALVRAKKEGSLRSPRDTSQPLLSLPIGLERYTAVYEQLRQLLTLSSGSQSLLQPQSGELLLRQPQPISNRDAEGN